jgi:hypothetical protein
VTNRTIAVGLTSPLPTIYGAGLTAVEFDRVNGARNRAHAAYARDCPEASLAECDRVARMAATDALRRVLGDRPAVIASVAEGVGPAPAKVAQHRPFTPSAADAA